MFNMFNLVCRSRLSNLGVSLRNPQINSLYSLSFSFSFSSNPSSLPKISGIGSSVTVDYLMNSCGFPREKALSASKYMNICKPDKADSVIEFLKNHGFTQTQILNTVKGYPQILYCDPQKTFLPKLEFFSSIGLPNTDIARVITGAPNILVASLENKIIPCYKFFQQLLQSDENVITMIKQGPALLVCNLHGNLAKNIQCLQEFGVPESNMVHAITRRPRDLLNPPDRFRRTVEEVKKMGFDPLRANFMWAVQAIGSMTKQTWERKVEIYKKWGFSEDEIFEAFEKRHWFMQISEDKMERVMDFIINKMGMKSSLLVRFPVLISLGFEKRIVPRLLSYKVLLDRGLIKKEKDFKFNTWMTATETTFINRIRKNYKEDAPQLLKLYQSKLDAAAAAR